MLVGNAWRRPSIEDGIRAAAAAVDDMVLHLPIIAGMYASTAIMHDPRLPDQVTIIDRQSW